MASPSPTHPRPCPGHGLLQHAGKPWQGRTEMGRSGDDATRNKNGRGANGDPTANDTDKREPGQRQQSERSDNADDAGRPLDDSADSALGDAPISTPTQEPLIPAARLGFRSISHAQRGWSWARCPITTLGLSAPPPPTVSSLGLGAPPPPPPPPPSPRGRQDGLLLLAWLLHAACEHKFGSTSTSVQQTRLRRAYPGPRACARTKDTHTSLSVHTQNPPMSQYV
jgi:hypothetical protein